MMSRLFRTLATLSLFFILSTPHSFALSSRTCNPKIPSTIKYRPVYPSCGNKAAIILSGKYAYSFSTVFKKQDHNDRLANNCPDASCSPFKAQSTTTKNGVKTICYGAAGTSKVFKGFDPDMGYNASYVVKWISIKLKNSGKIKDVEIYCLPKPYPVTAVN